ncbi:hypothetical protein BDR03DRAFT_977507 [Suillus americanus]|nr:hypothetical protein BDR03DRAFT_977507 [Suillus americanus]
MYSKWKCKPSGIQCQYSPEFFDVLCNVNFCRTMTSEGDSELLHLTTAGIRCPQLNSCENQTIARRRTKSADTRMSANPKVWAPGLSWYPQYHLRTPQFTDNPKAVADNKEVMPFSAARKVARLQCIICHGHHDVTTRMTVYAGLGLVTFPLSSITLGTARKEQLGTNQQLAMVSWTVGHIKDVLVEVQNTHVGIMWHKVAAACHTSVRKEH